MVAPLRAGGGPTPRDQLAAATSMECEFWLTADAGWKDDQPYAEVKRVSPIKIGFSEIATDEGTAQMTGDFGAVAILAQLTGDKLHFLQMYREGPLYVTTVFADQGRPGRLKAVQSRHEFITVSLPGFTTKPAQYYGDCAISAAPSPRQDTR